MSNLAEKLDSTNEPLLPETGFVRQPVILKLIPVSKTTWWRWVNEEKAPKPIKLGPKTTAWRAEDIRTFIEEVWREGGI